MAKIFYLLKQNNIKNSKIFGKWFAHSKTVETLKNRGIEAYYTTGGNVTVRTDGSTMVCSQG